MTYNIALMIGGIGLPEIAIMIVLAAIILIPVLLIIMFLLKIWRMSNDTRDIKNYLSSKNEEEENSRKEQES